MLTRIPIAAALAAISLAYAGNAAAQTDVLVVEGTKVGIGAAPLTPLEEPRLKAQTSGEQKYIKIELEDVMVSHVSPTRSPKSPDLVAPRRDEQKYMEFKLKEVLISGVIANGNPAQSPKSPGVPPSPASTGLLKFEGGSGKPAIAVNTPLRRL
jgi:hypothetical protein